MAVVGVIVVIDVMVVIDDVTKAIVKATVDNLRATVDGEMIVNQLAAIPASLTKQ